MEILDKLKTLFESKFRDIFSNNTIKFFDFSKNVENVLELEDGQRLKIDLNRATDIEKKALKEIIDFTVQNEEETFLTNKDSKKTEQIRRNLPKNIDDELLNFYNDKLNADMLKALEMSLVVRNAFKDGEEIIELKRDIAYKFPEFGNNICNLTTSNYFDGYFKELYLAMLEEDGFEISNYQIEVERIIKSLPYMVFINRYKSLEEFSGEVRFKLSKLRKYGADKLKLHAIGKDNVEKSLKIAEEYHEEREVNIEKEINSNRTIATLIFKF